MIQKINSQFKLIINNLLMFFSVDKKKYKNINTKKILEIHKIERKFPDRIHRL